MRLPTQNSLIGLLVVLVMACGCQKKEQVFPGYTYVGSDGTETGFVDLHSVQSSEDGVTFSFISQQPSGQYAILKVFSDCSSDFRRIGGTSYNPDRTVLAGVPRDSHSSPLSGSPVLMAAASAACGNPIISKPSNDNFQIQNALEALYGNYDPQSHTASWNGIVVPNQRELANFRGISRGTVAVAFDAAYRELGLDKHFVLTWTKPVGENYDCHVCLPLLSAAVLSKRNNQWSIESEEKYLILGASFGQRPRCQLVKIGPEKFGIVMHYSDLAQGFETEWIVLVAANGNSVKSIFTLTTRNDPNDSICARAPATDESCIRYSVEYHFVPGSNPAYFDILTTKKLGSEPDANSSTKAFAFVGDKYVPSSGTP